MSSLQKRLDRLREHHLDAVAALREAGLSRERVAEVVNADGVEWGNLTDGELRAVAPDPDAEVMNYGRTWGDLSDREVQRLAEGEPAERVL